MSETLIASDAPVSGHTARRLETRRKLLAAGTELFAEHGVPAVTSTAIAQHAGVATGTFYLHFDDKHELFEVLVDDVLDEMRAQFHRDALTSQTDAERRVAIEGMLDVVGRRRDLVRAVFDRSTDAGLAERIRDQLAASLESLYSQRIADGDQRLHPGVAAQARAAVLVRVIAWWADDPSRATRDEVVDVLIDLDPTRSQS